MQDVTAIQTALLVGLLVSSSTIAFWFGFRRRDQTQDILKRLAGSPNRQGVPEALELEQPFVDRVLKPALRRLTRATGRFMPQRNLGRLRHDLEIAGHPYGFTASDFLGLRLLAMLLTGSIILVLLQLRHTPGIASLFLAIAGGLAGSLLPSFWLRRRIHARQEEVRRIMPDALDMLTIAVSAGLGFDGALQKVSQKWDNILAEEFGQVIREMQIGIPRSQALQDMADRLDVTELSNFIAVLAQADHLGLSIANVLQAQSSQMRLMRRQRAEELAHQAPIKMLFPLIFLIFPAMFAVILGPAVPILVDIFGHL